MKNLKKDVQAVTKELKGIQKKAKQLKMRLDKIEKAIAAAKAKPRAKVKTAKKAPAKKAVKLTATDQV